MDKHNELSDHKSQVQRKQANMITSDKHKSKSTPANTLNAII